MSDAEVRRLERRLRQMGAPSDRAALERARTRSGDSLVFVYRTPHERHPFGLRVVPLAASSVLEWFQRSWAGALAVSGARIEATNEFVEDALKGPALTA